MTKPSTFCFRLNMRMRMHAIAEHHKRIPLRVPGFEQLTVLFGRDSERVGVWTSFECDGYLSEREAWEAGRRFCNFILVAGAIHHLGVDLGFDRSLGTVTSKATSAASDSARDVRAEVHGLAVGPSGFETIGVHIGFVQIEGPLDVLQKDLVSVAGVTRLTDRQRTCAQLLNDSLFLENVEGQLVLRVSAVEALCDQTIVGDGYREAVGSMIEVCEDLRVSDDIKTTIKRTLEAARRKSVRQSYLTKFKALLGNDEAKEFDTIYDARSALLHDGTGRGTLDKFSSDAMKLANKLLMADLRASRAARPGG